MFNEKILSIAKDLKSGESIKLSSYSNAEKKTTDKIIIEVSSPFENQEEYEKVIDSLDIPECVSTCSFLFEAAKIKVTISRNYDNTIDSKYVTQLRKL